VNRTHLTIITLIGTILGASVSACAQSDNAPADAAPSGHRMNIMERAMQGITLTPSEQTQIQTAEQKFRDSRKTATPETRADLKADIEAALTPAQRTQFDGNIKTIRAQMRAQRKARENEPAPTST
jgi:Spy/CpxP family protein refolding chaperone